MSKVRRGVAVHEAGHAVVAWALGLPVGQIEIDPNDELAGHSQIGDCTHLPIVDQIAVSIAGLEAQEMFERPRRRCSRSPGPAPACASGRPCAGPATQAAGTTSTSAPAVDQRAGQLGEAQVVAGHQPDREARRRSTTTGSSGAGGEPVGLPVAEGVVEVDLAVRRLGARPRSTRVLNGRAGVVARLEHAGHDGGAALGGHPRRPRWRTGRRAARRTR